MNQTSVTGPNQRETAPVPTRWMAKRPMMMPTAMGTTKLWKAGRQGQPFDGREHGNGGRDQRVTEEECGARDGEDEQRLGPSSDGALGEGEERERAAFAVVIGAQDQDHVFERDDDEERPEEERDDADDFGRGDAVGAGPGERFAQGVERACPDVAVHDPHRSEDQEEKGAGLGGVLGVRRPL